MKMDNAEDLAISVHLLAERDRLQTIIDQIRASGTVAPSHCWLVESPQTKGNRTYIYVRLVSEPTDQKSTSRSLGRPGNEKHRAWCSAIARREAIAELEQQIKLLEALIDRQAVTAGVLTIEMGLVNR